MPMPARLYVWAVSVAGVAMLGYLMPREMPDISALGTLVLFFVLVVVADLNPVSLAGGAFVTVATTVNLTNTILFGPGWAVLMAAVSVLVTDSLLRRPWYKAMFNAMGS